MIDIQYYAKQIYNQLALSRYHVHMDEVVRAVKPHLEDAFQRGVHANDYVRNDEAGLQNQLEEELPVQPLGTISASVEVRHVATEETEEAEYSE